MALLRLVGLLFGSRQRRSVPLLTLRQMCWLTSHLPVAHSSAPILFQLVALRRYPGLRQTTQMGRYYMRVRVIWEAGHSVDRLAHRTLLQPLRRLAFSPLTMEREIQEPVWQLLRSIRRMAFPVVISTLVRLKLPGVRVQLFTGRQPRQAVRLLQCVAIVGATLEPLI